MKTPAIYRHPLGSNALRQWVRSLITLASLPLVAACGSSNPAQTSAIGSPLAPGGLGGLGGCVPITSQIPFIAHNAQTQFWGTGSLAKVVAGTIPQTPVGTLGILASPGTYGDVMVGTVSASGGSYALYKPHANMQLAVAQPATNLYPQQGWTTTTQNTANSQLTGFVQLTQLGIDYVLSKIQSGQVQIPGLMVSQPVMNPYYPTSGYQTGYTSLNASQICVSDLAFSLNASGNLLGNGNLYLYLNGTTHGVIIDAL